MACCREFFFAVFSLFRFCISLQLLARPLVSGCLWALCTDSVPTTLAVAFFFELFWLDMIPVGIFIPPVGLFSTIISLTLIQLFGSTQPCEIAVILAVTIPCASCMAWLEGRQRLWQNRAYNALIASTRRGNVQGFVPQNAIYKGIGLTALQNGLVCLAVLGILVLVLDYLLPLVRFSSWLTWPYLWLVASLGAVLSMRFHHGYMVLASGIAVAFLGMGFL